MDISVTVPVYLEPHEILSLEDAAYDDWLDLYQRAFPVSEQVLVSEHNRSLRGKREGMGRDSIYLTFRDSAGKTSGMAQYDLMREDKIAALWYVAVREELRGQGIGSSIYQSILSTAQAALPGMEALLFEVEDPAEAHSDGEKTLAEKRIRFYRRNGAKRITGIRYMQSVGWQPEVPMALMIHCLSNQSASAAFAMATTIFGERLQQSGTLSLE